MVNPNKKPEYLVVRKDLSSYYGIHFPKQEKKHLEIIPEVQYSEYIEGELPLILITTSNTKIEDIAAEDLARTKMIIHPNSGYDNFSADFVKNSPFPIVTGNVIRAQAVANYILSCFHHYHSPITHSSEWDSSRKWNRDLPTNKKVLLIGYGMIGKIVHESLAPLCEEIRIYDSYKGYKDLKVDGADVVILASSLNPSSQEIVNEEFLDKLAPNFLLINGARGKLVDQDALIQKLFADKLAFAYLDVFKEEPFNSAEFIGSKNVSLSSHIAGCSKNLNETLLSFEFDVLNDFIHKCATIEEFKEKYKDMLLENRIVDDFLI